MSYGDGPDDEALLAAWSAFCDRVKESGRRVFKEPNPTGALQRADGFRFLTQNLSQAFDLALETKDTRYPGFHAFCGPRRKLGSDNADGVYLQAWIDGQSAYRVWGRKGEARFWNFTIQGARLPDGLHEPFGDTPQANLFGHELKTGPDGAFELFVGGERRGPNWLPTTPDSRKIFFRQFFDRWDEAPAEVSIERLDMTAPRPVPTPQAMIEAMRWAGNFLYETIGDWPEHMWRNDNLVDAAAVNRFNARNVRAAGVDAADARRGRFLTQMRWSLAPSQALAVTFDDPASFWMVTNEAVFGNSLDYLYRHVSYTPSRTRVDPDGKIRLVLAAEDPGYANWVETQGYEAGVLTYRNMELMAAPAFATLVVEAGGLGAAMPADSVRIDPAARAAAMRERLHAVSRRHRA